MNERMLGILNVNKPKGLTSRRVVDRVAKLVRPAKAGHAGTLDPLATGVLIVCVGRATRLVEVIQQQSKEYRARFILGKRSNTDDIEGEMADGSDATGITRGEVEAILPRFRGRIEQVPPQFSAVHVGGRRAYQLARAGRAVAIEPREVEIMKLELVEFSPPEFELEIECSSGTYVRSIGRDIGELLGCGAVMSQLVRTRIGSCRLDRTINFDSLTPQAIEERLLPATEALGDVLRYQCTEQDVVEIRNGRFVRPEREVPFDDNSTVAMIGPDGELACLAEYRLAEGALAPRQVFTVPNGA